MPEVRLIDGAAFEKEIDDAMKQAHDQFNFVAAQLLAIVKQTVQEQPTIEAEPVRHGRWIPTEYDGYADGKPVYDAFECSECGHEHNGEEDTLTAFCPDCGAKMDATDTNVGGKGDKEMDLSPLDFLAAEYDRKHPQGIRFVDCMEGADDGACKKV